MHPVLQEQVVKHLTSKGITLTPDFKAFLEDVDKAYTSCDNDRRAFLESSQVLADAQMIAKMGSWTLNTQTQEVTWSDELYRIFELKKGDFKPSFDKFFSLVHPDDKDRIRKNWDETITHGKLPESIDFRIVVDGGLVKWVQSRSYSADGGPDGKTIKMVGTLQDVTDRKNMEEAMNVSNERLRMLFDYAPDGYFLIDERGVIIDANKSLEKMTGLGRDQLVGKNVFDLGLILEEEKPLVKESLAHVAMGVESPLRRFTIMRKDGEKIVVENRGYPISIQGEKFSLSAVRDITDRQKTEEDIKKRSIELERLNKLMIGRELKMVELKRENESLKKKAGLN